MALYGLNAEMNPPSAWESSLFVKKQKPTAPSNVNKYLDLSKLPINYAQLFCGDVYKYTAQQKFSTDFNTMSHFEWTWTILFNGVAIYNQL